MDENRARLLAEVHKKMEQRSKRSSQIFFFDEKGNTTDKAHAVKAIVREYDENGQMVNETLANIGEELKEDDDEYQRVK